MQPNRLYAVAILLAAGESIPRETTDTRIEKFSASLLGKAYGAIHLRRPRSR